MLYTLSKEYGFSLDDPFETLSEEVRKVLLYAGERRIGKASTAPYEIIWKGAPEGRHVLTAKVVTGDGRVGTSGSVTIDVVRKKP